MNKDLVLIIMFCAIIYCIYKLNKLEKTEKFTTTNPTIEQQITTAVKKIYLADVEAIRILSNFAIQLSQGGTTIPGNVTFNGNVSTKGKMDVTGNLTISGIVATNNKDPTDLPAGWGGGLRTFDVYADGTIATGTNKAVKASMNNVGEIYAEKSIKIGTWTIQEDAGNLIFVKDGTLTKDSKGLPILPNSKYGNYIGKALTVFGIDGNLWISRDIQPGWVADNLSNCVKNDYFIVSQNGIGIANDLYVKGKICYNNSGECLYSGAWGDGYHNNDKTVAAALRDRNNQGIRWI